MNIEYGKDKAVKCYQEFVTNPDNRSALRAFSKVFGKEMMEPAKKLHDRLMNHTSVGTYNKTFGNTDNRIEIVKGCKDADPLILKVRVNGCSRKFFNHKTNNGSLLLRKSWNGDFDKITDILVIAVNNHEYNKV